MRTAKCGRWLGERWRRSNNTGREANPPVQSPRSRSRLISLRLRWRLVLARLRFVLHFLAQRLGGFVGVLFVDALRQDDGRRGWRSDLHLLRRRRVVVQEG